MNSHTDCAQPSHIVTSLCRARFVTCQPESLAQGALCSPKSAQAITPKIAPTKTVARTICSTLATDDMLSSVSASGITSSTLRRHAMLSLTQHVQQLNTKSRQSHSIARLILLLSTQLFHPACKGSLVTQLQPDHAPWYRGRSLILVVYHHHPDRLLLCFVVLRYWHTAAVYDGLPVLSAKALLRQRILIYTRC